MPPHAPSKLNEYAPFLWTAISNGWTANSSRIYLQKFGIGIVEWRLLATLGACGQSTSLEAARLSAVDPGAASRSMNELLRKNLVMPVPGRFPGRSKPFKMTPKGQDLFAVISALAEERLDVLLQDLSAMERKKLLAMLRKVYGRLPELLNE